MPNIAPFNPQHASKAHEQPDPAPATPPRPTEPDFLATLGELQGGILPGILTRALADVAMAVAEHASGKQKGKLTLELIIVRGKGPYQLDLAHKIGYSHPTARGRKTEEAVDSTTVFCNSLGHVSVVPDTQGRLFD